MCVFRCDREEDSNYVSGWEMLKTETWYSRFQNESGSSLLAIIAKEKKKGYASLLFVSHECLMLADEIGKFQITATEKSNKMQPR